MIQKEKFELKMNTRYLSQCDNYGCILSLTRWGAWSDAARSIDGSLPRAVAAVVPRWRVVAQAVGELNPASTSSGAWTPGAPRTPTAMVGRLGEGEEEKEDREGGCR